MKRDIENYNPQKITSYDRNLSEFTLYSVPMRLFRFGDKLKLTVEVYEKGQFNSGEPIQSPLNREFEIDYAAAERDFPEFFSAIENAFFDWLQISSKEFDLQMLDISLQSLKIRANAVNKNDESFIVKRETDTIEKFEKIKATYPNMVMAYFGFGRTFAAINDDKLALFK